MGRTGDYRYWERIKGTLSRKKNEVIESWHRTRVLTISKKRGGVEETDLHPLFLDGPYSFGVFPLPFPDGLPVVLG
jgi:hypothetical protein